MAAPHWVIFKPSGQPSNCVVGKKAEKAKVDIDKTPGWSMKEITRERCPFCNPVKSEDGQAQKETLHADDPEQAKDGQCHKCRGVSFALKFVNHVLTRECNGCGAWFNLETEKPWEE